MINEILVFVILLLSVPTGYLIAYLCRDELIIGRKWFKLIILISIISEVYLTLTGRYVSSLTLLFIIIVTSISFWKSFDKKLTSNRIS